MLRIVIDTNVLISSLLGLGPSASILEFWRDKKFLLITSIDLIIELTRTLKRSKITIRVLESDSKALIRALEKKAIIINPAIKIEVCRDPHDNKVLECAVAGEADCIVTGDEDLQILNPFRSVEIISPRDFVKRIKENT